MFRKLLLIALMGSIFILASTAQAAKFKFENVDGMEIDFWGFSQLTVEQFDRKDIPSDTDLGDQDSVEFDADRVRFGAKLKWGKWFGNLHLDANNTTPGRRVGGLASFIRDANAGYKFSNAASVKVGQFKTPIGMAFNMTGKKLPLPKRTFTDRLTFDRTLGAMISGRGIGGAEKGTGFGYDLFYGNPLGRSGVAAQSSDQVGDEHTWAARIMYDLGKTFHIEGSYGEAGEAGGKAAVGTPSTEDLETMDVGVKGKIGPAFTYRAEYIQADNVRGRDDDEEAAWFIEAAFAFNKMFEGVIRYEEAEFEPDAAGAIDTDIDAFEIGLNMYLGQNKTNGRVQLSYRSVGGDEEEYTGRATTGGFADTRWDAFLGQVQFAF